MDETTTEAVDNDDPNAIPDPVELAIASLGEPISVHGLSPTRQRILTLSGSGMIFGGIVLLVIVSWLLPNMAAITWKILLGPVILGIIILGQVFRTKGLKVYLFPQGLLRTGRGDVEAFLWDELSSILIRADKSKLMGERDETGDWKAVWFDVTKGSIFTNWQQWTEVQRGDGKKLRLSPALDDYPKLTRLIQQATFAHRYPDAQNSIRNGGTVLFGVHSMSQDQIFNAKGKPMQLADWKDAKLRGRILMYGKKSFFSIGGMIDLSTVSFPHVLVALLHNRLGGLIEEHADVKPVTPPEE